MARRHPLYNNEDGGNSFTLLITQSRDDIDHFSLVVVNEKGEEIKNDFCCTGTQAKRTDGTKAWMSSTGSTPTGLDTSTPL